MITDKDLDFARAWRGDKHDPPLSSFPTVAPDESRLDETPCRVTRRVQPMTGRWPRSAESRQRSSEALRKYWLKKKGCDS